MHPKPDLEREMFSDQTAKGVSDLRPSGSWLPRQSPALTRSVEMVRRLWWRAFDRPFG